jgi:hypothetical protein
MEAGLCSHICVNFCKTSLEHVPEDSIFHANRREVLRSHKRLLFTTEHDAYITKIHLPQDLGHNPSVLSFFGVLFHDAFSNAGYIASNSRVIDERDELESILKDMASFNWSTILTFS